MISVSYTHLDVYKRQALPCTCPCHCESKLCFCNRSNHFAIYPSRFLNLKSHISTAELVRTEDYLPYTHSWQCCTAWKIASTSLLEGCNFSLISKAPCCSTLLLVPHYFALDTKLHLDQQVYCLHLCLRCTALRNLEKQELDLSIIL